MNIDDFLIEEFKSRTQEIQTLMKEARQLELYSAGAVGAVYSWFVAIKLSNTWGWYFPLLIPVLGLIRAWAFHERIRQISEYIKMIETHFLNEGDHLGGWENWYIKIRKHSITPSGFLFWGILYAVCLGFPYLFINGNL